MGLFDIFRKKSTTPETKEAEEKNENPNSSAEEQPQPEIVADDNTDSSSTDVDNSSSADEQVNETATDDSQTAVDEEKTEPVVEATEPEPVTEKEGTSETPTDETPQSVEEKEQNNEEKYDHGLEKSRTGFGARLNALLANFRSVDENFFDDLEETMIESDVGFEMAVKISDELREEVKLQNAKNKQDVSNVIIQKLVEIYESQGAKEESSQLHFAENGPTVFLFVGVNGVGKTTTIGKMADKYSKMGKNVLLAAADTFRAGATEQLKVWGDRANVPVVSGPEQGDPASVVFDAVTRAKQENFDILFVDTAGRLQNKVNLMNELAKMKKIITRELPDAPHEVLLVLDATTGQNALTQAKMFKESTEVTGIVLTKLDGTARGGIVLAIRNELHIPVKLVGLGEGATDLRDFNASQFVYGLFKGLVTTD